MSTLGRKSVSTWSLSMVGYECSHVLWSTYSNDRSGSPKLLVALVHYLGQLS